MIAGVIYLYYHNDTLVKQARYQHHLERGRIIAEWKKLYGHNFNDLCCLQIAPCVNILLVDEKGRNTKKTAKALLRFSTPQVINRPPAIYNNIKSYRYEDPR